MKSRDELVKEIAVEIVNDKNYTKLEWDSISMIVGFEPSSTWESGILYSGDEYLSKNPSSFELTNRVAELRDLMKIEDDKEWLVCLIKISAVTQQIDIVFEYEDIKRWQLTPTMDRNELKAYAMSIR